MCVCVLRGVCLRTAAVRYGEFAWQKEEEGREREVGGGRKREAIICYAGLTLKQGISTKP